MARMGCPGAEGSPGFDDTFGTADDVGCPTACVEISDGEPGFFPLRCAQTAPTCDAVDRCFK